MLNDCSSTAVNNSKNNTSCTVIIIANQYFDQRSKNTNITQTNPSVYNHQMAAGRHQECKHRASLWNHCLETGNPVFSLYNALQCSGSRWAKGCTTSEHINGRTNLWQCSWWLPRGCWSYYNSDICFKKPATLCSIRHSWPDYFNVASKNKWVGIRGTALRWLSFKQNFWSHNRQSVIFSYSHCLGCTAGFGFRPYVIFYLHAAPWPHYSTT